MLAAALFASLWAQAEQAPAPAPSPPPAAAPAAPTPTPTPTLAKSAPPPRPNGVAVHARFAYRVGTEGKSLGPAAGFSLGGTFERRYRARERGLELGLAADFFYDRFATAVVGSAPDATGQETVFAGERTLSQTSFAVLQTVGWRATDMRTFAAIGPGVTIGYFSSPEGNLRPGSKTTAQPLARAVLGTEFALSPFTAVIIRVDYTHLFTRPTFTTDTAAIYSLFGDILDAGAGLLVRF
jgi:hypothetical protein